MATKKKDLISVQPRWWEQTVTQAAQLASDAARVAALIPQIEADKIDPKALPVLMSLLQRFSDSADAIAVELGALLDGSSTYLLGGDPSGPGADPADLVGLAQAYLAGQVVGDDVIVEQVWDYGTGPDALPDAIEAVSKKMRQLPPGKRKAASVFVLLDKGARPTGTAPVAG